MNETKTTHTPGPWQVYKGPMNMDGGLNPFFRGIVALLKHAGEDDDVCVILDRNEEAHDYEANARLIAAAPELLSALVNLTQAINELPLPKMNGLESFNYGVCVGLAEEAIDKATTGNAGA